MVQYSTPFHWPHIMSAVAVILLSSCKGAGDVSPLATEPTDLAQDRETQMPSSAKTADLLIENIVVIDAAQGRRTAMDVWVTEGQITDVTRHKQGRTPAPAQTTFDGRGKFLIPGLWDAHVHLAYDPDITYETFFPLSLAHGVTSLRDTGGHLDRLTPARALAETDALTPDLYVSGPLIDGPMRVYAGETPSNPDISVGVTTVTEAEAMVDQLAAADVDFIKAYEMLSPEAFAAVTERAQHYGLPVAAHTPLSMSVMDAVTAGATDMQHLRNIEFDCAADPMALKSERRAMLRSHDAPSPAALRSAIHNSMRAVAIPQQDAAQCQAVIEALAEAQVYQTPTLVISRFFSRKLFADPNYRRSFDLMPPRVAAGWKTRSEKLSAVPLTPETAAYDAWLLGMITRLRDAGVPIMAGTDAPIGFLTPGASLHQELFELVEAGLTPLEAITAATASPARFLNIENEIGLIAPLMRADLVVLNADPTADIHNIASIHSVIKDGRVLSRTDLDQLINLPQQDIEVNAP